MKKIRLTLSILFLLNFTYAEEVRYEKISPVFVGEISTKFLIQKQAKVKYEHMLDIYRSGNEDYSMNYETIIESEEDLKTLAKNGLEKFKDRINSGEIVQTVIQQQSIETSDEVCVKQTLLSLAENSNFALLETVDNGKTEKTAYNVKKLFWNSKNPFSISFIVYGYGWSNNAFTHDVYCCYIK